MGRIASLETLGEAINFVKKDFLVAICGYYGYGNLGDELLVEGIVKLLEKEGIERREILVLSKTPEETERKLNTGAVDRNDPIAVWKSLKKTKSFLLGGGGLFQDSTSLRSCFYYWGTIRMAEKAGCIPWAFGQSIGPLKRRLAEYLAFDAFRRCRVRVVRDRLSVEWLLKKGLDTGLAPDPAFALSDETGRSRRGGSILLNVRPWKNDLPEKTAAAVQEYASRSGEKIIGVALSPEDERCMTDLQRKGIIRFKEIRLITSSNGAYKVWADASAAFGMRLHFCVLSVMMGHSCVAVPYDPKVSSFANEWHLPQWSGFGMLPALEACDDDLPGRLAETREALTVTMRDTLEKVFPGRSK